MATEHRQDVQSDARHKNMISIPTDNPVYDDLIDSFAREQAN